MGGPRMWRSRALAPDARACWPVHESRLYAGARDHRRARTRRALLRDSWHRAAIDVGMAGRLLRPPRAHRASSATVRSSLPAPSLFVVARCVRTYWLASIKVTVTLSTLHGSFRGSAWINDGLGLGKGGGGGRDEKYPERGQPSLASPTGRRRHRGAAAVHARDSQLTAHKVGGSA